MKLARFVLRRLGWMLLTLWLVFTISFALMRSVPGGPFSSERALDPAVERNILARYHLDEPLWRQYLRELGNAAQLDLGVPYRIPDVSVNEIIALGFPVSAALGCLALVFALVVGVTAGLAAALRRGRPTDALLMAAATVGNTLPSFVVAGLLILLFVFLWPLFPAGGWGTLGQLVLPSVCLGTAYAADIARITRTSLLDVLQQDYLRTAQAKGLPPRIVVLRHALRGALLPLVSFLGPAAAGILTGSLVVERVFAIPGIGVYFVQAALQRDYTLAMGLVLLYTALLTSLNLLVDIAYTILDPRVELQ